MGLCLFCLNKGEATGTHRGHSAAFLWPFVNTLIWFIDYKHKWSRKEQIKTYLLILYRNKLHLSYVLVCGQVIPVCTNLCIRSDQISHSVVSKSMYIEQIHSIEKTKCSLNFWIWKKYHIILEINLGKIWLKIQAYFQVLTPLLWQLAISPTFFPYENIKCVLHCLALF